jgi:hypothetical protein
MYVVDITAIVLTRLLSFRVITIAFVEGWSRSIYIADLTPIVVTGSL